MTNDKIGLLAEVFVLRIFPPLWLLWPVNSKLFYSLNSKYHYINEDWIDGLWINQHISKLCKSHFCENFLTARLRWRGLRNGLFVIVVVLAVVLGKRFWIPRKKWTYTALLAEQRVNEISGTQSLSTKLMEINTVCPRN